MTRRSARRWRWRSTSAQFLQAAVGRPDMIQPCDSFFACGTEYGTDAGAEVLKVRSIERARAALKATSYNGEKVVILAVMENPVLSAMAQVADDMLRKIGMTTDFVATDFASMAQRRTNRGPVDKGGWSLFITTWTGTDILNPAVNQMLRGGAAPPGGSAGTRTRRWRRCGSNGSRRPTRPSRTRSPRRSRSRRSRVALHSARRDGGAGGVQQDTDRHVRCAGRLLLEHRQGSVRQG